MNRFEQYTNELEEALQKALNLMVDLMANPNQKERVSHMVEETRTLFDSRPMFKNDFLNMLYLMIQSRQKGEKK